MLKNDLSKCKVGDWVWSVVTGWEKITRIAKKNCYPVETDSRSFTLDGRLYISHKYPSCFTEPPACFNAGARPCEFKNGDRVLVKTYSGYEWYRRYFSHMSPGTELHYACYTDGADEWSSKGNYCHWKYCKKWEPEDE